MNSTSLKSAPPALFRWGVLFFISLAMFGNYYIYDSISPVADLLKQQLGFSDTNIGTLNAIYSIPNVIMVLIGGIIIDRIGTKKAALLFSVLMMSGGFITAAQGNLVTMAVGRLVFGLGAESMIVAITTAIARWFRGKELSFAFGLNLTIARLGSFMALNSPSWGKTFYTSWHGPLWFAALTGIISVVCLSIYWWLDRYAERNYELQPEGKQDKVLLSEIFNFSKSYWFICALCITFYSAMFPFQTFAVKFFQEVHGESREIGGFLSSILTLSAMFATPLFGLLSDRIGKRSLLMMCGSVLILPVYLLMAYKIDITGGLGLASKAHIVIPFMSINVILSTNLLIPMAMMGLAFSLIPAIMWPSVALVVEQGKLGTAYGLMTMIQNIGLAGFNLLIGWANDVSHAGATNPGGYHLGMWIFSSLGIFGFFFALMLRINERGPNSHGLEKGQA
ncbi:MAG: MFS transporter [Bacteroidota bacterium]|nr:MFS transporter [Bacteroidota bacterium]